MAKIWYLGHSAWCVAPDGSMDGNTFVFDYGEEAFSGRPKQRECGLAQGIINLNEFDNNNLFIFSSHTHADHYNKALHKKSSALPNVTHVLGGFKSPYCGFTMTGRDEKTIGGVTVLTAPSTDEGVCFLVIDENLVIFHAGDHADWEDTRDYYDEIDYLSEIISERKIHVDIAFIPVCTFSGDRMPWMTRGAQYAIERLKPAYAFPMHANAREYLYEEFAEETRGMLEGKGLSTQIVCMKQAGDEAKKTKY